MDERFQIRLLRLQANLHTRLRDVRDARKALVYGVRAAKHVFGASQAAAAMLRPGTTRADLLFTLPQEARWDNDLLARYIAGARPPIAKNTLVAPLRRRDRSWGALALQDDRHEFTPEHRQALFSITQILTEILQAVDDERTHKVRRRIEQKIADREDPKDLIYDIMHGLRSLTHYDHSASLLISRDGGGTVEVVAEQIAWTKAKSKRIGLRLDLGDDLNDHVRRDKIGLYERSGTMWKDRNGKAAMLPRMLDYHTSSGGTAPAETAMVCAPIATPDRIVGILKISARRTGVLGSYEADLVEEFVPLTSLAVQFSARTESLQERILQSERKHALANLTRGITHDVNNALGAMLPLVQQIREDIRHGQVEPPTLSDDLQSIERSIQTCRRIFGGMLSIARGSVRGVGHGNLRRAIDAALSVLEDTLKRRGIEVTLDIPKEVPTIRGSQGDLTQVFLNICTNAMDAMSKGGHLRISAVHRDGAVRVEIADTGCGIPQKSLERVLEPFFTTKTEGSGLGLSICRSILWEVGGDISIRSTEGKGTSIEVSLPVLEEEGA